MLTDPAAFWASLTTEQAAALERAEATRLRDQRDTARADADDAMRQVIALQARVDAANDPLWILGTDNVHLLLRANRVIAHVKPIKGAGHCWATGEYLPQSETEYTPARGGTLRQACVDAESATRAEYAADQRRHREGAP